VHRIVALIDGTSVASTDHLLCPSDCHNVAVSMRTRPASCGKRASCRRQCHVQSNVAKPPAGLGGPRVTPSRFSPETRLAHDSDRMRGSPRWTRPSLRHCPARGQTQRDRASAALRSWLRRERLSSVVRPKSRRCRWPCLVSSSLADEGLRRARGVECVRAKCSGRRRSCSRITAHGTRRGGRLFGYGKHSCRQSASSCAGAKSESLHHPNHMRPADGGAFTSQSKSSVQRLRCATIFPDSETLHDTSARMRFPRTPIAHRCIGQRRPNRRACCKQGALPATRMTIGQHCVRRSPHDLLSWACRFHFRSSFNCGSTTDVAELRIVPAADLRYRRR
jgi:hypothetical protein